MNRRLWLAAAGLAALAGCRRRGSRLPRMPDRLEGGWKLEPGGPPFRYRLHGSTIDVDVHRHAEPASALAELQQFRPIALVAAFQHNRFLIICRGNAVEQSTFLYVVRSLRNEWFPAID